MTIFSWQGEKYIVKEYVNMSNYVSHILFVIYRKIMKIIIRIQREVHSTDFEEPTRGLRVFQ